MNRHVVETESILGSRKQEVDESVAQRGNWEPIDEIFLLEETMDEKESQEDSQDDQMYP